MVDRDNCYSALFKLKEAGINIEKPLESMTKNSGVPRDVIEFLRDNSPQFQFYRYLQKHQIALAKEIRNYEEASDTSKIKICSSIITRAMIAIEYNNIDRHIVYELNLADIAEAINYALISDDYSKVNKVLETHRNSIELFYLNNK